MPQGKPAPGTPQDWLARAKSDPALARLPLPTGAIYEDLCFHAQQAAEKALKAVYQYHGWIFQYTHDLEKLVAGLEGHGLTVPPEVDDAIVLTSFAWESRYPGFGERVSEKEYREALRRAEGVVTWAEREIGT
jgi:HEPN domain-containing protein